MTAKDAYQYFVLKAQDIAISQNWIPVNWYVSIPNARLNISDVGLLLLIMQINQLNAYLHCMIHQWFGGLSIRNC